MNNNWPTQKQDMQTASAIVNKYMEYNAGEPLGFLELVLCAKQEEVLEIKIPDWISELLSSFKEQYGYEHGYAVTNKVLTKILLKNEVIH